MCTPMDAKGNAGCGGTLEPAGGGGTEISGGIRRFESGGADGVDTYGGRSDSGPQGRKRLSSTVFVFQPGNDAGNDHRGWGGDVGADAA